MNMSAGLLARRLTSMAPSNPQIRKIIKSIDDVLKARGGVLESVENLQDLYNILNQYLKLSGKTGFEWLITTGVEKVRGVKEFISKTAGALVGKTDAVKKDALEKIFRDIFSGFWLHWFSIS